MVFKKRILKSLIISFLIGCGASHQNGGTQTTLTENEKASFEWLNSNVFTPKKCASCHSASSKDGGLKLETYEDYMQQHPQHGWIVKSGDFQGSGLWQQVSTDKMPVGNDKLTQGEKDLVKLWIANGLPRTIADAKRLGGGSIGVNSEPCDSTSYRGEPGVLNCN